MLFVVRLIALFCRIFIDGDVMERKHLYIKKIVDTREESGWGDVAFWNHYLTCDIHLSNGGIVKSSFKQLAHYVLSTLDDIKPLKLREQVRLLLDSRDYSDESPQGPPEHDLDYFISKSSNDETC